MSKTMELRFVLRSEAIGMLKDGLAQKDVASRFQVSFREKFTSGV